MGWDRRFSYWGNGRRMTTTNELSTEGLIQNSLLSMSFIGADRLRQEVLGASINSKGKNRRGPCD